ncbi:phage tail family protein [Bacillus sp. S13(2024)]|uniref:phage tail family protein n=1 Tax=unclassified Bacillus (in: firmicutes) TaxID=185979 RepID=UPI003D19242C
MESFSRKEKLIFDNNQGQTFEISVLSPFFLDSADGLESMENSFYTTKGYAEDGVSVTGSNVKDRNIVIKGRIRFDKEINRSKMIRFFNPKHDFTLKYTNGEIERFIKCKIEKTPVINKEPFPSFMISLLCPKPWWYTKEIKTDIALWVGTFEFPLEIPQDIGIQMGYREPSLIVNVNNTSDNIAPLRLEFKSLGTLTNPSIINVETRELIMIEKEMIAGDVISINTERGNEYVRLTRNGVTTNAFNYLALESNPHLAINVGDNLLRYDAATNANNLEVSIYFTPQYVGV